MRFSKVFNLVSYFAAVFDVIRQMSCITNDFTEDTVKMRLPCFSKSVKNSKNL